MSYGVGHRYGSGPELLWLWCRLAATAPIGPPAWEPSYAVGTALKRQKTKKKLFYKCPPEPAFAIGDGGTLKTK